LKLSDSGHKFHPGKGSETEQTRRALAITEKKLLMYRRPKFLEVLHAIREEMSREVDYDVDLFAEMVRSGVRPQHGPERIIRGVRTRALREDAAAEPELRVELPKKRAGKRR
jgi:hypothetical protein